MKSSFDFSFTILSLSLLKGIGATFIKKNLAVIKKSHCYSASENAPECLKNLLSLTGKKYTFLETQEAVSKAEDILAECEAHQIKFISLVDKDYPQNLFGLNDPPPILFLVGNSSLLKRDAITIIGTRKPNRNGQVIAERVGSYFASKGWSICNGLADGIDTFAIKSESGSCLKEVIGVVGSGLDSSSLRSLPKQSVINIERVLESEGLIVSEIPPSKKQNTFSVVKSCRIQAGLSSGLILIQSSIEGGSRFTVKAAIDSDRPLGVIYPVKADIHENDYSANRMIIEGGLQGLSEFVGLKNGKNSRPKLVVLSGKESYPEFEEVLKSVNKSAINKSFALLP
ncbi:DNA-processing protein DprA [Oscillatoria sp. FACHB-1407]|uniref:DNA-processing protein DprA n=1 Tax=Oscillatoria sp. FACHB-1407 TaxID=2692847 RepID=UPI0016860E59|nr:DNA-processing protein DprA [Oscillatoria sp. FACHB-1407]MBD2463407.1 DNA-processing protein DprA [Oscillatoria sp. FACHB-1407]